MKLPKLPDLVDDMEMQIRVIEWDANGQIGERPDLTEMRREQRIAMIPIIGDKILYKRLMKETLTPIKSFLTATTLTVAKYALYGYTGYALYKEIKQIF